MEQLLDEDLSDDTPTQAGDLLSGDGLDDLEADGLSDDDAFGDGADDLDEEFLNEDGALDLEDDALDLEEGDGALDGADFGDAADGAGDLLTPPTSSTWDGESLGDDGAPSHAAEGLFLDAMEAADEDEFISTLRTRVRGLARNPLVRQMARRALPLALRILEQGASELGRAAGGRLGGTAGARQGAALGRTLGRAAGTQLRRSVAGLAAAMDAFADAAADYAADGADLDSFIPVQAALAGRFASRCTRNTAAQAGQARQANRQILRATSNASRQLVGRFGPRALRIVPRIVRQATAQSHRQGSGARAIPRLIVRAARRAANNPRIAQALARPSSVGRRLRARVERLSPQLARPSLSAATTQTIRLRAPVRLIITR